MEHKSQFGIFEWLLVVVCAFQLIVNVAWIGLSTAPIPWDQAGHTRIAIFFAHYFADFGFLNPFHYFAISTYYPPLVHTIAAIPIMLFGNAVIVTELLILAFFLTSIVFLYLYTTALFQSKAVGFLTATVYSLFPIVYEHAHWFLLEIPLLTFFFISLWAIERSHHFTKRRYTILFFAFAGCALLTKWLAVVYYLPIVLFYGISWLKQPGALSKKTLSSVGLGLITFAIIAGPWYLANAHNVWAQIPLNVTGESSDPQNILSEQGLTFYLYLFTNFQVTVYMAALFVIGLVALLFKRGGQKWLIISSILVTYGVFTLIQNKDWRYTMPMLAFVAMTIGYLFYKIAQWQKFIGITLSTVIIGAFMTLCVLLLFREGFGISYQQAFAVPGLGFIDSINLKDTLARSYHQDYWPQAEVLQYIDSQRNGKPVKILVIIDQERFNAANLFLARETLGLDDIDIQSPRIAPFVDEIDLQHYLEQFQFAIVAQEKIGVEATRNINNYYQAKTMIDQGKALYAPYLKTFPLPNGDRIAIFGLRAWDAPQNP